MNVESIFGHITAMHRVTAGHHVTVAAAVGATVLTLDDTADFDEAGGQVLVSGQVYDYDAVDPIAHTLTLTEPLTVAAAVDDPAELFDPEVGGTIVVEYEADVLLDDQDPSDRPIQVSVPHGLVPMLEESVRGGIAEAVSLVRDGEHDWTIWQVEGKLASNLIADEAIQSAADAFSLAEDAMSAAEFAQATADGKINSFYQTTAPTSGMGIGDLWFDTDDRQAYRYNGTSWVSVQDQAIVNALAAAESAQVTADGKIVHFVGPTAPTAEGYGDIWTNTSMGNRRYYWDGDSWEPLISGNQAFADEFIGKTFTATSGGQFRTSSGADGIKINSSGLFGYNSSGALKTFISPSTGLFTTYGQANFYDEVYVYAGGGLTIAAGAQLFVDASFVQFNNGLEVFGSADFHGVATFDSTVNLGSNVAAFTSIGQITASSFQTGGSLHAGDVYVDGVPSTANAANAYMNPSTGRLLYSTSTERHKENIRPAEIDVEQALALQESFYESNLEEDDPTQVFVGFIAEQAADLGLDHWVARDDDGQPIGFNYATWPVAQQAILRNLHTRVLALEGATA